MHVGQRRELEGDRLGGAGDARERRREREGEQLEAMGLEASEIARGSLSRIARRICPKVEWVMRCTQTSPSTKMTATV